MFSIILWTILLFFIIHKTNKELGKIEGKNLYIHSFLLWLFLMMFSTSFKMLGWAIRYFQDIPKYFYIQVGIFPDWFNLLMWALYLIFGIIAFVLIFSMAKRKEKARKKFLLLLPIFYIITLYEMIKGSYINDLSQTQESSIFLIIFIGSLVNLIPFGAMYYFYNKIDIKNKIFTG